MVFGDFGISSWNNHYDELVFDGERISVISRFRDELDSMVTVFRWWTGFYGVRFL